MKKQKTQTQIINKLFSMYKTSSDVLDIRKNYYTNNGIVVFVDSEKGNSEFPLELEGQDISIFDVRKEITSFDKSFKSEKDVYVLCASHVCKKLIK